MLSKSMPKAYSVDLKKKIFSVSIESVKRWWKIFQETNDL